MTAGQMNVRIDEQLRIDGTAALESIGFSPSRIVRAIWAFAAKNKDNPAKLEHAFSFLNADSVDDEKRRRLALVEEGGNILSDARKSLGIEPSTQNEASYHELKEEAYLGLWKEKGLL